MKEREYLNGPNNHGPIPPSGESLPADLARFLRSHRLACLLIGTVEGSAFVVKAPGDEIAGLHGPMPVLLRHELYRHRTAPVICLLLRLYDRPPAALAFESFVNVDDAGQRRDYGDLARQDRIDLHFYDEALQHRLAKQVPNSIRRDVPLVLATALRLRARIPDDRFDFDRAKDDVLARTSL
jgi:hypothetical protein